MERKIKEELIHWMRQKEPMPLIIRGARQVGKTYTVESFGKEYFENTVTINFEFLEDFSRCFEGDFDPKRIVAALEILTGQRILPGKTLLFFDEIQQAPRAITALRYFKEKMPNLHVIAAGSLLEFVLEEENFSFPVGRVQFLRMYPMSFQEFLRAMGHSIIVEHLENTTLESPWEGAPHDRLIELVRDYLYVGGMPAAIQAFSSSRSFLESRRVQLSLLQTYQNDFSKYSKQTQHKTLRKLFEKAPELVGKHFKYSKVDPEAQQRDIRKALDLLCHAGLITKIHHTSATGIPLRTEINEKKFKLLMLDVGLMQAALQTPHALDKREILGMHHGAVAEQFSGQELLALSDSYEDARLHFWEREKKGSAAEVDYVKNMNGKMVPIEVKSGAAGRLRSLRQFMEEKKVEIGVRISEAPLTFNKDILSIPFYLLEQAPRLLSSSFSRRPGP